MCYICPPPNIPVLPPPPNMIPEYAPVTEGAYKEKKLQRNYFWYEKKKICICFDLVKKEKSDFF